MKCWIGILRNTKFDTSQRDLNQLSNLFLSLIIEQSSHSRREKANGSALESAFSLSELEKPARRVTQISIGLE